MLRHETLAQSGLIYHNLLAWLKLFDLEGTKYNIINRYLPCDYDLYNIVLFSVGGL